jgi:hypothetical protein
MVLPMADMVRQLIVCSPDARITSAIHLYLDSLVRTWKAAAADAFHTAIAALR